MCVYSYALDIAIHVHVRVGQPRNGQVNTSWLGDKHTTDTHTYTAGIVDKQCTLVPPQAGEHRWEGGEGYVNTGRKGGGGLGGIEGERGWEGEREGMETWREGEREGEREGRREGGREGKEERRKGKRDGKGYKREFAPSSTSSLSCLTICKLSTARWRGVCWLMFWTGPLGEGGKEKEGEKKGGREGEKRGEGGMEGKKERWREEDEHGTCKCLGIPPGIPPPLKLTCYGCCCYVVRTLTVLP